MPERRALYFVAPRRVEVRVEPLPPPKVGEKIARGLFSAVSQGTELLLFRAEAPVPFDPSLDAVGQPTYPRTYGYAWVGELVETGERIFALAPHASAHVLTPGQYRSIPPAIPSERATLAANLETALNVCWDSGVGLGDEALVLGGGVVGTLIAWVAARSGAQVTLIEPAGARRTRCGQLGFAVRETCTGLGQADVVFEATGKPEVLDEAIAHTRAEGRVVVASFYGQRRAAISLGEAFHRRRLSLISSQVSKVSPSRAARFDFERRFAVVWQLLEDPRLDALLEPAAALESAPEIYSALDTAATSMHTLFRY